MTVSSEFVLVPREPTEAMLATQGKSRPDLAKSDATRRVAERLNDEMRRMAGEIWHEMLAAAPTPRPSSNTIVVTDAMVEAFLEGQGWGCPCGTCREAARRGLTVALSALQSPQYTGGVGPIGCIDKWQQNFASAKTHAIESLIAKGWTPVFASPPEGRQDGGPLTSDAITEAMQICVDLLLLAELIGDKRFGAIVTEGAVQQLERADAFLQRLIKAGLAAEAALTHSTPVEAPTPVAWMRQRDIDDLASMHSGATNKQIANISFGAWTVPVFAGQPLLKQGTGEAHHIDDAELLEETERQVREMLATDPETTQPDTYTGGNFNGVTEGEN